MITIGIGLGVPFSSSGAIAVDGAPSLLIASPYSGTRIDLSWTNTATIYDGVSIEGSTDGINFSEYETVGYGETTANITGLTENLDYWFRAKNYKGSIYSDASNTVQTYTYPAALIDGHTLLWIPYEDSSLYTLSGANVTEVTDKLASGRKFIGGATKPTLTANGIYMPDGADMTATFNYSANYTLYVVMALHEYRNATKIIELVSGNGLLFEDANNKYQFKNGTAGVYAKQSNAGLDTYCVFMMGCKKDTTTGFFRIDDNVAATAYVGATDQTFLKFIAAGISGNFTNHTIKEIILRDQYEYGTATLTSLYNYLVKKK